MPKNIVICCDGTANQYGKNNTNVVKLYEMIEIGNDQYNFYDPGVGTSSRAVLLPIRKISNLLSQGLGLDLNRNVEDAYQFLMDCYNDGDKIFLFGFSRGAHTVRRLADVLGRCGLLYPGSDNMVPYVLRMYESDEKQELLEPFKNTYTRKCPVHFLGVWDTVSALSRIIPRSKLDGILSSEISYAYHAVSIDEKRLQFPPNLFNQKSVGSHQTVEEVWFAGVHSDVGGFYAEAGLSNIALKWMFEKAIKLGLKEIPGSCAGIKTDPKDKIHKSWTGIFWFVPWHVYIILFLGALLLVQIGLAYLNLFWDVSDRPLYGAWFFIKENCILSLVIFVALIFATKCRRKIPDNAKVHNSVKVRMGECNYHPKNLEHLKKDGKIIWVD